MVYLNCKAIVHRGEYRVAESPVQFRVTCIASVVYSGDDTLIEESPVQLRTLAIVRMYHIGTSFFICKSRGVRQWRTTRQQHWIIWQE